MRSTPANTTIAAAVLAAALATPVLTAQTNGPAERYSALAVNMDGGRTASIEITVNRWSTDAERERLLTTAFETGPDKLLKTLQDLPKVGFIRNVTTTGWDLHYARHVPLPEGGERVVVATDRPISGWESFNQSRTLDYPFTVVELHLNPDGEGEGKMSFATKIEANRESGTIVLENWGTSPVVLQGVRREHTTH